MNYNISSATPNRALSRLFIATETSCIERTSVDVHDIHRVLVLISAVVISAKDAEGREGLSRGRKSGVEVSGGRYVRVW